MARIVSKGKGRREKGKGKRILLDGPAPGLPAGTWKPGAGSRHLEQEPRAELDTPRAVRCAGQAANRRRVCQRSGYVIEVCRRVSGCPLIVVERIVELEAELQPFRAAHRDVLERRDVEVPIS